MSRAEINMQKKQDRKYRRSITFWILLLVFQIALLIFQITK